MARDVEREPLVTASEELKQLSGRVDDADAKERLQDQSQQLQALAEAEQNPDHGRLDRHMHVLSELQDEVDEDIAEHVEHAREEVKAYRETVEGV